MHRLWVLSSIGENEQKALKREKRKLSKWLAELDKLFSAQYEDKVLERITERNFDIVSRKYEEEQSTLTERLEEINVSLTEKENSDCGVRDFFSLIANYADTMEFSAAMVNSLIERITVGERVQKEDGTVEQTIKIYYKFVGNLSDELHITPTKRPAPPLPAKRCECCGTEFVPGSPRGNTASLVQSKSTADRAMKANSAAGSGRGQHSK